MKYLNLKSIAFIKNPNYVRGTPNKVFDNLVNRDFTAVYKNMKWCMDFKYIRVSDGKILYN